MADKAKYWTGVCYPENMRDDWQDVCEDLLGIPFCYCIHDKDKLQIQSDIIEHEERKVHVHFELAYTNTTTEKTVYNLLNRLSKEDRICCPKVFVVPFVRKMYDYLIHDTNNCRKQNKHLYDEKERICCNNFDIGQYEQISLEEKNRICGELSDMIVDMNIKNFMIFYKVALENYKNDAQTVKDIIKGNSGFFDRLIKGNYYYDMPKTRPVKYIVTTKGKKLAK